MGIQDKIEEYYNLFKGLPSTNPIVRENQPNDAFEILVYELLLRKNKYSEELTIADLPELERSIVPPKDDTIDIFYEEDDGDDSIYHIIQVKNSDLAEADIKVCFASMKRAIESFINDRPSLGDNLKKIIAESNFDDENKTDCIYYVVHAGQTDSIRGQRENEKIVTIAEMEILLKSVNNFCVPYEEINTDKESNFIEYENNDSSTNEKYTAYQVNLNGHDLAVLCNKYINSEIGKNILFGQNLRESLSKSAKTYSGMFRTIDEEPQNFWFYNNGITIIAEHVNLIKGHQETQDDIGDILRLTNFSIINGAQTTSTLGNYLKTAQLDNQRWRKDNLKKIYVTARVVETKENKDLRSKITIYNNTQNPISSRDMVSNNEEQKQLQKRYLEGSDISIFIQTKRGQSKPKSKYFQKHQIISNDELAQFVFASFLAMPYVAKEKKNSLFNRDNSSDEYELNKDYYLIFNYSDDASKKGELFKRTKDEINELLFVKQLHGKARKYLKDIFNSRIEQSHSTLNNAASNDVNKQSANRTLDLNKKLKQINNINTFYNIALYYAFKRQFDELLSCQNRIYDYNRFYKEKKFEQEMAKAFAELFSTETNEIIFELGHDDPAKFTRASGSQKLFFDKLSEKLAINTTIQDKYKEYIEKYKI